MKPENNRAWLLVLPVLVIVAFSAIIPLMTVVNYSVQETFGNNIFFFEGIKWFQNVLTSDRFHAALGRQLAFTATILAIELPLGVAIALAMPRKGPWLSVCLVLMALPLLIPWNVGGAMWNIFALPDIGLLGMAGEALKCQGINECAGTAECAGPDGANDCQGMNECKGMGWVSVDTEEECTSEGGEIIS